MWLTRFGGNASEGSSAGIAFQGSLSPVDVPEASRPSVSIAAPLAAMVASPRTAVTSGQQNSITATLPAFQPGSAPTVVPDSSSTVGAGVLAAIAVLGIMFISRFRVR